MEPRIVALDSQSKVIYALYNIFTPFLLYIVIAANLVKDFTSPAGLMALAVGFALSAILALYLLINGICGYSRFVQVDDKYLYICKKRRGGIQVLDKIDRNDIKEVKCSAIHGIDLITNTDKTIRLMNCSASITLMVLTAPIFCIPFALKGNATRVVLNAKINELLGIADEQTKKAGQSFMAQVTGFNIFCWIFLVLFILIGALGIVLGGCAFLYEILGMLIAFLSSIAGS